MTEASTGGPVREYRLTFEIDPDHSTFHGTVDIDATVTGGTLVLNSSGLELLQARCGDGTPAIDLDASKEEARVGGLPDGPVTVSIDFRGRVADTALVGLYRTKFGDGTFLTTQCAATEARRIFPCVDRPDAKASIFLDLTVGIDDGVVFNTPIVEQRTRGKRKRLRFDPTPPMSTYLFYLGVGHFEELRGKAARVRLAIVTPPGRRDEGEFALERASLLLPAYEQYFQIPYPLTKLDLVTVPELSYGAMENWGAITFREMRLLIGDSATSAQRRDAVSTITHEIAHQWFGNLVTMRWWDDIWLNESFASFMEPKMIERVFPGAGAAAEFVLGWTAPALLGDSLPGTHPVRAPVERVEEIAQIFDEISYGKGSSVLRMIEAFVGEETFQKGVTGYLQKFRFGNATSADLWASLEEAAGRPLRDVLEMWVGRPGVPVVALTTEEGRATLAQRRFTLVGHRAPEPPWSIPMVVEADGAQQRLLFDAASQELPVRDLATVHLNPGGLGFYRTLYDAATYQRLRARFDGLPALHRWSVLQDLYAFLLSGDVGLDRYLDFVDAVAPSSEYVSVLEVVRQFLFAGYPREPPGLFGVLHANERYLRRMTAFFRRQADRLCEVALEGEPETDGILRGIVGRSLVWCDPEHGKRLAAQFGDWDNVDPDLAPAVAFAFAREGGESAHSELLRALEGAADETTALRYEAALTTFRDPKLVASSLDLLGTPRINRGHSPTILLWGAINPQGRDAVWSWMVERSAGVQEQLRGTGMASEILERTLPFIGIGREPEVRAHFASHPWPEAERGTRKGLDLLRATARLATLPP